MTSRLNDLISTWGVDTLDYDSDVEGISEARHGGSVTERHLLFALVKNVVAAAGKGASLVAFVEEKAGLELRGKIKEYLLDETNPHYLYDLLGVFKSGLISEVYIQPDDEECVGVVEVIDFAKRIGAIPAYAYLGDVTDSPTGDKKAEAFEDSYLEELFDELEALSFQAVTYMPPRNTLRQLRRVQSLCSMYGLMEISGVDINSSRQSFNCPELLTEEFSHLGTSAWALIAHEKLSSVDASYGLFQSANPNWTGGLGERLAAYGRIGASIDPRNPSSAIEVLEKYRAGESL
jgi:hypothetical protein